MTISNLIIAEGIISLVDPLVIATILLAIATFILAFFTWRLLNEAKSTRIASQLPIFAVEPSQFIIPLGGPLGGEFHRLNLVNHGQPATDLTVRCMWLENENSAGSSRDFYIVSLAKDGYASLDIPAHEIAMKRLFVKVQIACRDSIGNPYQTTITNGLDKIRGTNALIAYQNNYWLTLHDAIDRIGHTIQNKRI